MPLARGAQRGRKAVAGTGALTIAVAIVASASGELAEAAPNPAGSATPPVAVAGGIRNGDLMWGEHRYEWTQTVFVELRRGRVRTLLTGRDDERVSANGRWLLSRDGSRDRGCRVWLNRLGTKRERVVARGCPAARDPVDRFSYR